MNAARLIFAPLALALLAPAAPAEEPISKVIDARKDKSAEGLSVVFCSRDSPGATGAPGHAYVVIARDDEEKKACVVDAFGFQPAKEGDKGVVSEVPGKVVEPYVKDYDKPLPGACRLIVKVDRSQLAKLEAVRTKWSDHEYSVTGPNCIDFADQSAKALGLKTPKRSGSQRPHAYMRALAGAN